MSTSPMRTTCLAMVMHYHPSAHLLRVVHFAKVYPLRLRGARAGAGPVRRQRQMQRPHSSIIRNRPIKRTLYPNPRISPSHSYILKAIYNQTCTDRQPRVPPGHIGPIRLVRPDSRRTTMTIMWWVALCERVYSKLSKLFHLLFIFCYPKTQEEPVLQPCPEQCSNSAHPRPPFNPNSESLLCALAFYPVTFSNTGSYNKLARKMFARCCTQSVLNKFLGK